MRILSALNILSALALLPSCASVTQELDPEKVYRRDMQLEINGMKGDGVLVLPEAQAYAIDARLKGAADLFTMSSCHRERVFEDAGQNGFFGDKKRVRTTYVPAAGVEAGQYCPLQLGGYERVKGRHSWAFIDVKTAAETLPATVACDGANYVSSGVTVCQSREGLIQQLIFSNPVRVGVPALAQCALMEPEDGGRVLRYKTPRGMCVYAIKEIAGEKRLHRLTTIGYESIPIRGD